MHLRVCPNPDCGKVSDISATQCEHCGTVFPKIALAEPGGAKEATSSPPPADVPLTRKTTIAAWPLIIVALVAGGLPLLWFNRAYLPAPKPWQPEAAKPVGAPLTPPVAPPAPAPSATPTPTPPPAAPVIEPPAPTPAPTTVVEEVAKPDNPAEKPAEKRPEAKPRETKKPKPQATAAAPVEPARPCTEAIAALGLCDPKQAENK